MSWASAFVAAAVVLWGAAAVVLAIVDLQTRRLPTKLIWPTAAIAWVLYSGASLLRGEADGLVGALAGALVCSAPVLLIHLVHPPSMGFGDVRFSVLNGLVCGWWGWHVALIGLTASFLAALPEAVVVMARQGMRASRPLGPYLAVGTAAAVIWSVATAGLTP